MLKHVVGLAVVASVLSFGLESVVLAGDSKATTVRVVDKAGFDAEIALHKGKIVLVDCWATWCVPCVKEFPKTVAMSHDFADKGLVVISLSFDELADGKVPPKVQKFLDKQGADFPNLISELPLAEEGGVAFGINDGALPHMMLFDRKGKLIRRLAGTEEKPLSHDDVASAVEKALKTSK